MIEEMQYLDQLATLVAIDTTSPMNPASMRQVDRYLVRFGLSRPAGADFWVRRGKSDLWIYSHIDVKPAGDSSTWEVPPFALTQRGSKLFGRGVSDSKFQLLNALMMFGALPVNFIIDGSEECSGVGAGKFLNASCARHLVVVDGSSDVPGQIYGGMMGQLDGSILFDTGNPPSHPGRYKREKMAELLTGLFADTRSLHFNPTRMNGGEQPRSLTLEKLRVDFDLRYGPKEAELARAVVEKYGATLRQDFPPVYGTDNWEQLPMAPFSNPLGMTVGEISKLWVLPGGHSANGAHRPNEWIDIAQIDQHRTLLRDFIQRWQATAT